MDKETLSNYGWIVICVLVLAVMIALAGPFGNFVADAVKSTAQGLFDVNQGALDAAGIVIDDNGFADGENGGAGINGTSVDHNGPTIPEGAYYGNIDLNTFEVVLYTEMPEVVTNGDTYLYGDYMYNYMTEFGGWGVALATSDISSLLNVQFEWTDENQTSYGVILENINGVPVTYMGGAFVGCSELLIAPEIPSTVTNMGSTFENCNSLTVAPNIPSSVTNMGRTFYGCTSLTGTIQVPCHAHDTYFDSCPATVTYYHVDGCDGSCGK